MLGVVLNIGVCNCILFSFAINKFLIIERKRWQDIENPVKSVNRDPNFKQCSLPPNEVGYTGGIFNPLSFAPTLETKEKEIALVNLSLSLLDLNCIGLFSLILN